ncbi:hypothetical protein [Pedobacter aquatilis]|nr:hypothetical protein [Pedobacter aquatilis]
MSFEAGKNISTRSRINVDKATIPRGLNGGFCIENMTFNVEEMLID